ncbi:recombinase family protein [Rothia mucilaginosa]|uniref:recombinase family protein n=1 Tax=Rothia mucilaginosa TaxID=43675 RepID=UPI0028DB89DA|nr:recombinase family protein [Rothia mucilaginosa]
MEQEEKEFVGQIVGYARVSAVDQNVSRQVKALEVECDKIFVEKVSAAKTENRPQFQEMMRYLREGDILQVTSADRLARSTRDLLDIVQSLKDRGVQVEFLDNPALNTDTPQGEFMLTILAAVAQLERSIIRERQAEGIAIARAAGKYDRAPKLSPEQASEVRKLDALGVPKTAIARKMGCSRHTVYAVLDGIGKYGGVEYCPPISIQLSDPHHSMCPNSHGLARK